MNVTSPFIIKQYQDELHKNIKSRKYFEFSKGNLKDYETC